MSGISKNCTFSNPCPICGKPDWCNIVSYPNGDMLCYCHRTHGGKGDVISAGGKSYRYMKETESGFTVWQPLEQYERFIEGLKGNKSNKSQRIVPVSERYIQETDLKIEGVVECLPPEKLDVFYRTLLSLLVLENKHEQKLRAEWDSVNGMFETITSTFPIKSMPPEDRLRFSTKEKFKNNSRKKIMEQLISKCGEPKGVPGFYQRKDGIWTMHPLCGIVFPVFDTKGRIIRIRINTDYPVVKGIFEGVEGRFTYNLFDKISESAGWYFTEDGSNVPQLVWQYGSNLNRIFLDKKGYPKGKVNGKYMNFTSYKLFVGKNEQGEDVRLNRYTNGCESGSFCSVYTKKGDDPTWVYVTEGEKKAIVANLFLNVPVISVPGVNSVNKLFDKELGSDMSMMDSLKSVGARGVILVFDADKSVNEAVLYHEQKAVEQFKERKIHIALGEWNPQWGKGLDDVLLTGVKPAIHPVR